MYKHLPSFVDFFKGQLPRNKKNLTVSWHEFTEEKRTIVFYEEAETLIKLMEGACGASWKWKTMCYSSGFLKLF